MFGYLDFSWIPLSEGLSDSEREEWHKEFRLSILKEIEREEKGGS